MKPTFIGIGPPRCGTTSVYCYLRQHAQVHMSPRKETDYFAYLAGRDDIAAGRAMPFDPVKTWTEYRKLFDGPKAALAAGEISTKYFWWPGVCDAVHAALPQIRIFCILRNPVERAYSSYRMHTDYGDEGRTFGQVCRDELDSPARYPVAATNRYVRTGFYAAGLTRWREFYGPKQLGIFFFDDLAASPSRFMRDLFQFIGVDPRVPVDTSTRFNTSGTLRLEHGLLGRAPGAGRRKLRHLVPERLYRALYRVYSTSLALVTPSSPMSPVARDLLRNAYAEDIRQLQALTGRDLAHWLDG